MALLTEVEHLKTTKTPPGWDSYDGSIYTPERGHGWLEDLRWDGRDRGVHGIIVLADGTKTSPRQLDRPELANFHGKHPENHPLVFRIDLENGWYRVSCASVDPDWTNHKPLVDQRSFKCRAHDVVFAGANYNPPLVVSGRQLVEGSAIVEVTDGHLRIVVGDPAYSGWTWSHQGPWYSRLNHWWRVESRYANDWYQRLARTVDPGFHALGLNSLEVVRVSPPRGQPALVFRDFFNRDDSADVNNGVAETERWTRIQLHPRLADHSAIDLYKTAIRFVGPKQGTSVAGLLQQQSSPTQGIVRYSTRVSLFAGAGTRKHSGTQEAGIVLLAERSRPSEINSTFVGVQFDSGRSATKGWLVYSVGNGHDGYRTKLEIPDTSLPFRITEGEFEIIVEHDVAKNLLRRVEINGTDVTDHLPLHERLQRLPRGRFGVRSAMHNTTPQVRLQQFYWYFRVESVG